MRRILDGLKEMAIMFLVGLEALLIIAVAAVGVTLYAGHHYLYGAIVTVALVLVLAYIMGGDS